MALMKGTTYCGVSFILSFIICYFKKKINLAFPNKYWVSSGKECFLLFVPHFLESLSLCQQRQVVWIASISPVSVLRLSWICWFFLLWASLSSNEPISFYLLLSGSSSFFGSSGFTQLSLGSSLLSLYPSGTFRTLPVTFVQPLESSFNPATSLQIRVTSIITYWTFPHRWPGVSPNSACLTSNSVPFFCY